MFSLGLFYFFFVFLFLVFNFVWLSQCASFLADQLLCFHIDDSAVGLHRCHPSHTVHKHRVLSNTYPPEHSPAGAE